MWEDEKKKKGKTERLFSNGVIILVFLILSAQAVFFTRHLIERHRAMQEAPQQEETQAPQDNVQDNTHGQEGLSARNGSSAQAPPSRSGSQASSGVADRYGRTSSVTADTRSGSTSTSAGSSPHTDSTRDNRNAHNTSRSYFHDGWKWDMVELNSADSATLDDLPGIGPYYAKQILKYRERLGCYADIGQLLDIRGFDTARLERLADRLYIEPSSVKSLDLQAMSVDSMASHPYIGPYAAKGIDRLRRTVPDSLFSLQTIMDNGILSPAQARRLALYVKN